MILLTEKEKLLPQLMFFSQPYPHLRFAAVWATNEVLQWPAKEAFQASEIHVSAELGPKLSYKMGRACDPAIFS